MRPPFGDTTAAADGGTCKDALALPTGLVVYCQKTAEGGARCGAKRPRARMARGRFLAALNVEINLRVYRGGKWGEGGGIA